MSPKKHVIGRRGNGPSTRLYVRLAYPREDRMVILSLDEAKELARDLNREVRALRGERQPGRPANPDG